MNVVDRFLNEHFPGATTAVIAGSTSRGERTASSDIDLLLIGEHLLDDGRQSLAATYAYENEIIEVFAYTQRGFNEWATRGVREHRPVIVHMLVEGTVIKAGHEYANLRAHWDAVLAQGPTLSTKESTQRRYVITDLLDDLRDATDPFEQRIIATLLVQRTAELMLLDAGRWIASGKWLPRRLRALDTARADALASALLAGDHLHLADVVQNELDRAGGRVQAGFIR
jgi:hypothetical protein